MPRDGLQGGERCTLCPGSSTTCAGTGNVWYHARARARPPVQRGERGPCTPLSGSGAMVPVMPAPYPVGHVVGAGDLNFSGPCKKSPD